jgi:alpha-mannosidase
MHKFSDLEPEGLDALRIIEKGPVRTVYRVRGKITIEAGDCNCVPNTTSCERPESLQTIEKTIFVYHKIPLITWEIRLPNWPEEGVDFDAYPPKGPFNVEFRAALPIAMTEGKISYEVPMGVLHVGEEGFEFSRQDGPDDQDTTNEPGGWTDNGVYTSKSGNYNAGDTQPREVQNFISANDDGAGFGVTLSSSVAVADWVDIYTNTDVDHWPHPGEPQSTPVLQPVLLATRHSCHGDSTSNWYGFEWELGEDRRPKLDEYGRPMVDQSDLSFRFSLKSHEAGWLNGFHFGHEANNPLLAVSVDKKAGSALRPLRRPAMSFARVTEKGRGCNHVVITTLKRWQPTYPAESENEKTVILRLSEIAGQESTVRVFLPFRVAAAESVNMIEEDWDHPSNSGLPKQKIDVYAEGHSVRLTIGKHAIETIKLTMK